jgi:uncharacterized surface protein with fasciclin (FAS1) repeats
MKRNLMKGLLGTLGIAASLVIFTGCEDDDAGSNPGPGTIANIVVNSDNFSTLESAVIKADLAATLNSTGPFTVFAPDNAAFTASGITPATLNSLTADQVESILLYHTLASEVKAVNVPAGPNAKVVTASGDSVFVTKNASGVFVNGVKVTQADIDATNGVIHKIERVLMPPVGNIVATAQVPGSGLDSLVKAVVTASTAPGGDPTIVTALQNNTLTVFAPNNAAFTQLLTALGLNNISNIPIGTLVAVLKYHLVPGRAFSSDLANGSLTMAAGGSTTINLTNGSTGGPTITGTGNAGNRSNIVAANIMARNGVVHVIDRVLLP